MAKSKRLPGHTIVVRTYAELERYAQAFASGHLSLLLVLGAPGLGKSRAIRKALGAEACWIDGNASPFGIYMAAYEHLGLPLALDDVDGLYRDRQGIRLLKCLCQTEKQKTLSWETNAPALAARGIPRRFSTTSQVVLLANDWESVNVDVAALEDRAHLIYFDPSPLEIHLHAAKWFWDQEIFDFVGAHLHLAERHSLRVYHLAYEQKLAGLDWRRQILNRCLSGAALEVAKLKADPSFASEEARAAAFVAAGYGCRATYFNHGKKLKAPSGVPAIQLARVAPPEEPAPDILEILRRRHKELGEG